MPCGIESERSQHQTHFSLCSGLLIETVDDGALIYSLNSGATSMISNSALGLLNAVRCHGKVDQSELERILGTQNSDGCDLSSVLVSLEKSELIFRC